MAEEGHQWSPSRAGYNILKMNLGDEDVKRRKDEIFEGHGVIVWGLIPKLERKGGGIGLKKKD
jgi:hypothetical protein